MTLSHIYGNVTELLSLKIQEKAIGLEIFGNPAALDGSPGKLEIH